MATLVFSDKFMALLSVTFFEGFKNNSVKSISFNIHVRINGLVDHSFQTDLEFLYSSKGGLVSEHGFQTY